MEDVSPFVTHLAQLVWLLSHEPDNQDGQKEELRRALNQLSSEPVVVSLNDIASAVSAAAAEALPDETMRRTGDLAMRLASHSVRAIQFDAALPPRELMDVARALASQPQPGDEGESIDARLVAANLTGVSAQLGATGFVRRPIHGPLQPHAGPVRTPSASMLALERPDGAPAFGGPAKGRRPSSDSQAMMQSQLMRVANASDGVIALLAQLDAALASPNPKAVVDDAARAAEDLAGQSRWEEVIQVLERLHDHHDAVHDDDTRRAFLLGIRRLQRPIVMSGVAQQLPNRRDLRSSCTRILIQAGEVGADVLIDNLISSEDGAERRAYLEVLRQSPAAVTSLLHLLSDDRWYVVRNAAILLGELGAAEADRRLSEALGHREPRVRRAVVTALGKLATSRALLALLQALNDPSPDVRLQAAHGIAENRNSRAVPWLLEALDQEQDPDVQGAILSALGRSPTEDGVARLMLAAEAGGMLVRKPTAIRLRAIDALSEAGTPSARRALEELRADRDREIRAAVERAVGRLAS